MSETTATNVRLGEWVVQTRKTAAAVRPQKVWHGMVLARKGDGKTSLAARMPKPILIDEFEPDGESVFRRMPVYDEAGKPVLEPVLNPAGQPAIGHDGKPAMRVALTDMIESGDIIVRRWYEPTPECFVRWTKEVDSVIAKTGGDSIAAHIGTWVIDTVTMMNDPIKAWVLSTHMEAGLNRKGVFDRMEWERLRMVMLLWLRKVLSAECHVVLLGHLAAPFLDTELSGTSVGALDFQGSGSTWLTRVTPEVYTLETRMPVSEADKEAYASALCSDGMIRTLRTRTFATTLGSTKLGLRPEEPADMLRLLKRAGLDWNDKGKLD